MLWGHIHRCVVKPKFHLFRHVPTRHDTLSIARAFWHIIKSWRAYTARHARHDARVTHDMSCVSCHDVTSGMSALRVKQWVYWRPQPGSLASAIALSYQTGSALSATNNNNTDKNCRYKKITYLSFINSRKTCEAYLLHGGSVHTTHLSRYYDDLRQFVLYSQ